jgi:hypothetical protein
LSVTNREAWRSQGALLALLEVVNVGTGDGFDEFSFAEVPLEVFQHFRSTDGFRA